MKNERLEYSRKYFLPPNKEKENKRTFAFSFNFHLANQIYELWTDPGIQQVYQQRNLYFLSESAEYFLDQVNTIAELSYVPTDQDILRVRIRTTGIIQSDFMIENNRFCLIDVGGQRNERKKWIHCFENVTAILFIVALSEFNQTLFEDKSINRMQESLNLFEHIINLNWFKSTSIILFLNKRDIFFEKLNEMEQQIVDYFPEYKGDNSYEDGVDFFQSLFEIKMNKHYRINKNNNISNKQLYIHVTCATDTKNVEHVFRTVKNILINQILIASGLK